MTRNYFISWSAPPGTTTTELNAAYKAAEPVAPSPPAEAPSPSAASGDWPSYNKTLTSERYSELDQINTQNVGKLKVLCTYDVGQYTAFESGLIMVDNALIGTTQFDIFSLNPATCAENWRTHEDYPPLFRRPIEAPPTWTACCFAAPRTGGCWAMTSRPASESGKR
jgi:alcohol dehydrogenase (cytochrome c)